MIPISSHGRGGVMDILGDCGSPDPGSIPGPGPLFSNYNGFIFTHSWL
jgi:hypothetical protein